MSSHCMMKSKCFIQFWKLINPSLINFASAEVQQLILDCTNCINSVYNVYQILFDSTVTVGVFHTSRLLWFPGQHESLKT